MATKDLLLIGGGVAIGYLIFKKDLFKKKGSGLTELNSGAGEIVSEAEQAKIEACNKSADDFMAMSRFASGADLVAIRKAKFEACMSDLSMKEAV